MCVKCVALDFSFGNTILCVCVLVSKFFENYDPACWLNPYAAD